MGVRDRNTVKMVAEHWGCSADHVRRLIDRGVLPALRLGGVVRITREQVEQCEAACNTKTRLDQGAARVESFKRRTRDPFEAGQLAAGLALRNKQK